MPLSLFEPVISPWLPPAELPDITANSLRIICRPAVSFVSKQKTFAIILINLGYYKIEYHTFY